VRHPQGSDLIGFAVAATLAICTKDQAYAFFVLPAAYALWLRLSTNSSRSITAVLTDRGLALAALGAGLAFVVGQNLVFNFQGFLWHVQYLSDTSTYSPAYAVSLAGYSEMLADGVVQLSWSMGWPSLAVGVGGLALTLRHHPRAGFTLVLFVLSYYVFFLAVIRYQFDRFFLGVCIILGIAGGRLLAELLRQTSRAPLWRTVCAAIVVAGVLYGAWIPVTKMSDSRYGVEAWLEAHVPQDDVIAYVGRRTYLPRVRSGSIRVLESWSSVSRRRPDVLIVNQGYSCRARPGTIRRRFYDRLDDPSNGLYELALSHRPDPWWPVDGPDAVFRSSCENNETNLSRINPEIRVYRLVASS
jgi:hypothetical protein